MENYKELLEKAKEAYSKCETEAEKRRLESIFPELAESEDEKIRKDLIQWVNTNISLERMPVGLNYSNECILAWLEKQGEHDNFLNKIRIGDKVTRNADGVLVNLSQLNRVAQKNEKQGENLQGNSAPETVKDSECVDKVMNELLYDIIAANDNTPSSKEIFSVYGKTKEDCLAWLERKNEQDTQQLYNIIIALWDLLDKIDTFSDLQIDDTNLDNPFRKIEDITKERHKFVKSDGYNLYIKGEKKITDFQEQNAMMFNSTGESQCEENGNSTALPEKQGEHKSANKVEPKFKVDDWIACECFHPSLIVDIVDDRYEIEFIDDGTKRFHSIEFIDEDEYFHKWTIWDAKDGDVVVDKSNGAIGIFQNIGHDPDGGSNNDPSYCFLHCRYANGFFYADFENGNMIDSDDLIPATKEQRDKLEKEITKAGYRWNQEERKLEKI